MEVMQYVKQSVDERQIAYYTPRISQEQYDCLNRLIGAAAFDDTIKRRLFDHDETLRAIYCLSDITWSYLVAIEAYTIEEMSCHLFTLRDKVLSH
jgi:hypothetical protein